MIITGLRKALLIVVALITLVACSTPVTSGVVVAKNYHPSYEELYYTCYSYDKDGRCTYQSPNYRTVPERFEIVIEGYAEGETELKRSTHRVPALTYDKIEIGDEWSKT